MTSNSKRTIANKFVSNTVISRVEKHIITELQIRCQTTTRAKKSIVWNYFGELYHEEKSPGLIAKSASSNNANAINSMVLLDNSGVYCRYVL
jgi:hypothetical protein